MEEKDPLERMTPEQRATAAAIGAERDAADAKARAAKAKARAAERKEKAMQYESNPVVDSGLSNAEISAELHKCGFTVDVQSIRKWRKKMPAWWALSQNLRFITEMEIEKERRIYNSPENVAARELEGKENVKRMVEQSIADGIEY